MGDLIYRDALMDDLIYRGELIKALKKDGDHVPEHFENVIKEQPAIEAVPVVHGEWIKQPKCLDTWKCTNCNEVESVPTRMGEPLYSFCPNCGADMRKAV